MAAILSRPQCVNTSPSSATYITGSPLVQIMDCRLFSTKPLHKPMLTNCQFISGPLGANLCEIWIKIQNFPLMKMHWKMLSRKRHPFCPEWDEWMACNPITSQWNVHNIRSATHISLDCFTFSICTTSDYATPLPVQQPLDHNSLGHSQTPWHQTSKG